jgi:hypothetical protein
VAASNSTSAVSTPRERDLDARVFATGVAACMLAVAAFLAVRLTAWPPHEDETLALFVGRKPLDDVLGTVLNQRGGAPLHFLWAWAVAHLGGGLTALRAGSAFLAAASVPLVALLGARLASRRAALVATVLASASWMLLFHGVYGRMYSLFLVTSTLSFLALLSATERGGYRRWALWAVAILACVASHPYGAIVLAAQGVYVVALRARLREAAPAFAAVLVLGIPFWRTDLVLAGRFEIGVGGGGTTLGSPVEVIQYLWETGGDFSAGYEAAAAAVLFLALLGMLQLGRTRPRSAALVGAVVATPVAALMAARLGSSAAPESRHLIFVLPFFCVLVACGILRAAAAFGRAAPAVAALCVLALVPVEVAWGWDRTPDLFRGESPARVAARDAASAWLAATSRPDDVLFGYDPLFLQAWKRGGRMSHLVVPRADARLALRALRTADKPLGRGVWVFDASDTNNATRRLEIARRYPRPREAYEARAFGPFLVVRTLTGTGTVRGYLKLARQAQLTGKSLGVGDADTNLLTILQAGARLAAQNRDRPSHSRSRSTASR